RSDVDQAGKSQTLQLGHIPDARRPVAPAPVQNTTSVIYQSINRSSAHPARYMSTITRFAFMTRSQPSNLTPRHSTHLGSESQKLMLYQCRLQPLPPLLPRMRRSFLERVCCAWLPCSTT